MTSRIKSADIKPGDIIKFEYGTYDNWITVRIDEVHIDSKETYYPLKLIWHYLSDEPKEAQEKRGASKDCRAEKLGNNPASKPYRQFTSYSNPNDLVVKLTQKGTTHNGKQNTISGQNHNRGSA